MGTTNYAGSIMEPESANTTPTVTQPAVPPSMPKRPSLFQAIVIFLLLGLIGFIVYWVFKSDKATDSSQSANNAESSQQASANEADALKLDLEKDYGNKYEDGILPVGDDKYVTDSAKKGNIYMCNANFVSDAQAGAQTRGPWFVGTTEWDINKKYSVQGSVNWDHVMSNTISGDTRTIATNNLPSHVTGIFPVLSSDPAYSYDRNPNSISEQSLTYSLEANPSYGLPQCMGGEVGVLLTGVAIFNGFDAGGRDAGAWEIQDACEGHPQASGIYHYHTLSSCITDVGIGDVIGFALDGFPITGPKVGDNNFLTTDDLDECHGITSEITLDGKKATMYHYVMTQDFPYSVSCFRAKAIQPPGQHSDGEQTGGQSGSQQGQSSPMPPDRQPPLRH